MIVLVTVKVPVGAAAVTRINSVTETDPLAGTVRVTLGPSPAGNVAPLAPPSVPPAIMAWRVAVCVMPQTLVNVLVTLAVMFPPMGKPVLLSVTCVGLAVRVRQLVMGLGVPVTMKLRS